MHGQVASHAQKFYLRRQKVSMGGASDKRRASINDITTLVDYSFSDQKPVTTGSTPFCIDNNSQHQAPFLRYEGTSSTLE